MNPWRTLKAKQLHIVPGELRVLGIKGDDENLMFAVDVLDDDGAATYTVVHTRDQVATLIERLQNWLRESQ